MIFLQSFLISAFLNFVSPTRKYILDALGYFFRESSLLNPWTYFHLFSNHYLYFINALDPTQPFPNSDQIHFNLSYQTQL